MTRVLTAIDQFLRAFTAFCLFTLTTLVVLQVVARYVWGGVPFFIEEMARYAMIWMALLSAALGVRDGAHIRIDFVPDAIKAISPDVRRWLEVVLDAISLTVFLALVWYGINAMMFAAGQTSEGMRIPLSYPYAVLPISFALAALFSLLRIKYGVTRK